ncbi:MAG: DUF4214 domain-containing protein [Reyranellaceae bacterium]
MTTTMNFNFSPTLLDSLTAGGSANHVYAYAFAFSSGTLVGSTTLISNGAAASSSIPLPTSFASGAIYVVIQQNGNGTLPGSISTIGDINPASAQSANYSYQLFEATLASSPYDQGDISSLNTFGLPATFQVVFQNGTAQTRGYAPGLTGQGIYDALGNAQIFSPNTFPSPDRLAIGPATANDAAPWPSADWTAYVNAFKASTATLNDIQLVVPFTGSPLQSAPMLSQYGVQYVTSDQYGTDYFWLVPNTMNGATNTDWIRIPASQLMQNIYVQPGPLEVHVGGKNGPVQQQQSFTPNNADGAVAKYFIAGFDAGYWGGSGTSPNPKDLTKLDLNHTWNWNFNYAYNATLNSSGIQYSNLLGSGPGTAGGNNRFYDPWAQFIQKNSNAYGYSYTDLVSEGGVNPQITLWDPNGGVNHTGGNIATINIGLYDNSETLPATSGYLATPVPYVPPSGATYAAALTQAATANQIQFAFNYALGSLSFAPNDQTPAFFKFYAPSDPTAGTDGFVSLQLPGDVANFPGIWNYMQLSHSSTGWTLTPTNKAGNSGFFDIINVPVTSDGSPAWYQLVFGGAEHQTIYNIYAKSDATTHNFLDTTLGTNPSISNFVVDHGVSILEVTNSNYALNFAPGGSMTYDIATFSAPNTIFGSSGDDALNGNARDNILNGGIGDDVINGGAGFDTAVSWAPSSHYLIKVTAGDPAVTVQDKVGANGTDHVTSIEFLQFGDQILPTGWFTNAANLAPNQVLKVVGLYTAGLGRAPDAVGLDYWSSQLADGKSLGEVSKAFFASSEAAAIFNSTVPAASFVTAAYISALGRAPDPAGSTYWINELQTGHIARSDLITALINGALSSSGSVADAQYVTNKEAVGAYFAITQGLTNGEWARAVESSVNASAATVTAANQQTDQFAVTAAAPASSELVVQLVGILP